jgi:hypothetical protein
MSYDNSNVGKNYNEMDMDDTASDDITNAQDDTNMDNDTTDIYKYDNSTGNDNTQMDTGATRTDYTEKDID